MGRGPGFLNRKKCNTKDEDGTNSLKEAQET